MKKILLLILLFTVINSFAQSGRDIHVYFDTNSAAFTASATATLDSLAAKMGGTDFRSVSIKGFTDETGKADANKILAQKRADAVKGYLGKANPKQEIMAAVTAEDTISENLPDRLKRRVTISLEFYCNVPVGYEQRKFTGAQGTVVYAAWPCGSPDENESLKITESFSTPDMIRNSMYGIDEDGEILRSWGMVNIVNCLALKIENGFYTVRIPVLNNKDEDPDMTLWREGNSDNGQVRWKNTKVKTLKDARGSYYEVKVPASACNTRINLDKRVNESAGRSRPMEVVYIVANKPYDFNNVGISKTSGKKTGNLWFSAKVNDTTWAFVKNASLNARSWKFWGKYKEGDQAMSLTARMSKCRYSKVKNAHYFYMTEESLLPEAESGARKKGFWAWMRRQFGADA